MLPEYLKYLRHIPSKKLSLVVVDNEEIFLENFAVLFEDWANLSVEYILDSWGRGLVVPKADIFLLDEVLDTTTGSKLAIELFKKNPSAVFASTTRGSVPNFAGFHVSGKESFVSNEEICELAIIEVNKIVRSTPITPLSF